MTFGLWTVLGFVAGFGSALIVICVLLIATSEEGK